MKKLSILISLLGIAITVFVAAGLHRSEYRIEPEGETKTTPEVPGFELISVEINSVPKKVHFNGRLLAKKRVELFSEVPGRLLRSDRPFEEGTNFREGELLVRVDAGELTLQVQASRSAFRSLVASFMPDIRLDYPDAAEIFDNYMNSIDPGKILPDLPDIDEAQLYSFLTARGLFDRYYQIRSAENRLEKYEIRAPFNGILVSAEVEEGFRISPQTHLGTFISDHEFELVTTLRPGHAAYLSVGDDVLLTDQAQSGEWTGRIERKNVSIDRRTQGVKVYIHVKGEGLAEGLYLEGFAESQNAEHSALIPKTAFLRTGHVYILQNGIVEMKPVEVVGLEGNLVRVKGLQNGDKIIANPGRPLAGVRISGSEERNNE